LIRVLVHTIETFNWEDGSRITEQMPARRGQPSAPPNASRDRLD